MKSLGVLRSCAGVEGSNPYSLSATVYSVKKYLSFEPSLDERELVGIKTVNLFNKLPYQRLNRE